MDKRELLNLNNEYYSKLIEKIIIGGCDEKEIKDYYIKKNNDELKENKFPKIKKLFSIPFNAEFDDFDVKYFIILNIYYSIFILIKFFFLKNHNFFIQV